MGKKQDKKYYEVAITDCQPKENGSLEFGESAKANTKELRRDYNIGKNEGKNNGNNKDNEGER